MNKQTADSILEQIMGALPAGWEQLRGDLDRNLHSALRSTLTKLDLVTRDEFEIQREVLARTRAKCDQLAEQIAALEGRIGEKSD